MPVPLFTQVANAASPSGSEEFVDDVDLMFERRVNHVNGEDVLGYWCTLCRANPSKAHGEAFFRGENVTTLRKHIAAAGDEHYSTYRERCKAAGVKPNPQCSPDGVIVDDETEQQYDPLREHKAFEKALLLCHYQALVCCTEMTLDQIEIPAFRAFLQFGRADLTDECFPTRNDILEKVRNTSARVRTQLPEYFKEFPGKVSISVALIMRGGMVPYIAVVAHWVNKEWEAKEGTLLFEEMGWEYTAEDISYHVMKALKRFALDNKNKLGWIAVHNDNKRCFGAALRLIANQIDPEGLTWKPKEMAARTADRVEFDTVNAFMSIIKPDAEESVMKKLKAQPVEPSPPSIDTRQSVNSMEVDINPLSATSVNAPANVNQTLGKLFALFRRMRQEANISAYDYFEKMSKEEKVELVLFDRRWEWSTRQADVLEGLFVKLVNARKVYDKFTATADTDPSVRKLPNGENFKMFAMDDADWDHLTSIRNFLHDHYVASSSLDNDRDKKRCTPPTIISVMQMVEGYWGRMGEMRDRTKCEVLKRGIGKAMHVLEEVLGRADKVDHEDGRLVAGDSCFIATALDPRVKLAYYKEVLDEETYRAKLKALEDLFMRYYVPPLPLPTVQIRSRRRRRHHEMDDESDWESDLNDSEDDSEDRDEDDADADAQEDEDSDSDAFNRRGGLWYAEDDRGERDYGTGWIAKFTAKRIEAQDANGPKRELFEYLDAPLVVDKDPAPGMDILKWWLLKSIAYPTLYRIARDVLAIPGLAKLGAEVYSEFDKIPTFSSRTVDIEDFESMYVVRSGYAAGLVTTQMERRDVERRKEEGAFRFGEGLTPTA